VHGGWFRIAMRHLFDGQAGMLANGQVTNLCLSASESGLPALVGSRRIDATSIA
jgi:hypothetical protein